jgi:hypothetical protein
MPCRKYLSGSEKRKASNLPAKGRNISDDNLVSGPGASE